MSKFSKYGPESMFDFNHDGKLDRGEQALYYSYLENEERELDDWDDDDEEEEIDDFDSSTYYGLIDDDLAEDLHEAGINPEDFEDNMTDYEKYRALSGTWLDADDYEEYFDDFEFYDENWYDIKKIAVAGVDIDDFHDMDDEDKYDELVDHGLDPEDYYELFDDEDYPEERAEEKAEDEEDDDEEEAELGSDDYLREAGIDPDSIRKMSDVKKFKALHADLTYYQIEEGYQDWFDDYEYYDEHSYDIKKIEELGMEYDDFYRLSDREKYDFFKGKGESPTYFDIYDEEEYAYDREYEEEDEDEEDEKESVDPALIEPFGSTTIVGQGSGVSGYFGGRDGIFDIHFKHKGTGKVHIAFSDSTGKQYFHCQKNGGFDMVKRLELFGEKTYQMEVKCEGVWMIDFGLGDAPVKAKSIP